MGEKRVQNEIVGWNQLGGTSYNVFTNHAAIWRCCTPLHSTPSTPAGFEEVESEQYGEVSSLFTTVRDECNIFTRAKFEYRGQVYMHIIFEERGHAPDLPLIRTVTANTRDYPSERAKRKQLLLLLLLLLLLGLSDASDKHQSSCIWSARIDICNRSTRRCDSNSNHKSFFLIH